MLIVNHCLKFWAVVEDDEVSRECFLLEGTVRTSNLGKFRLFSYGATKSLSVIERDRYMLSWIIVLFELLTSPSVDPSL